MRRFRFGTEEQVQTTVHLCPSNDPSAVWITAQVSYSLCNIKFLIFYSLDLSMPFPLVFGIEI
jgi:hypothetical protein